MKLSIIIPAYNEEKRIEKTLRAYYAFFAVQSEYQTELLVVLNGCKDQTLSIVQAMQHEYGLSIRYLDLKKAGKGFAIKNGFLDALSRDNDLIGFVDADMATRPEYFFDLVIQCQNYDGVIASRYMPESKLYPPRPFIKRWGSRIVYESLVRFLFGLTYYDFQCGAKLFKRVVIEKIAPLLTVQQWAFDVELLYLCKKYCFSIKEIPTTWYDQDHSKLSIKSGFRMLANLFSLRLRH